MIEIPRLWTYANESDALHFMVQADGKKRHVILKKTENRALYEFLAEHMPQRDS